MENMEKENMENMAMENDIAVLWSVRSTNGRWGMAIVGPAHIKKHATHFPFPVEGKIEHLGTVGRISTWRLYPGKTGQWILPAGDVKIHGGARVIDCQDLQSSYIGNILLLSSMAVIEEYGFKRRSSQVHAYINGVKQNIPGPVLLALGLIQAGGKVIEVEPPPPLEGAMAEALRRAFPHLAK